MDKKREAVGENEVVLEPELVEDISSSLDFVSEESEMPLIGGGNRIGGKELIRYDPLNSYLAEIKNVPRLSREEERALAIRYLEHGDQLAGYKLVLANLRLVVMIAREYQKNFRNILDLVQEGNIGLLEAVKKFDPYRGIRFPSYAVYWIRAYMLRYLINNIRMVKIGTTQAQRKLFFNLEKEKKKLEKEGFIPESKLLAEKLKVKESEVIEMEQRLALPDLSVDAPTARDSNLDLHDVLPSVDDNTEEVVAEQEYRHVIRVALERYKESLGAKEKDIIDLRLMADKPTTLQVIADKYNLSRERIRQIENELKTKLKEYMAKELQIND